MAKLTLNEVEAKEVIALNFDRFLEISWKTSKRDGYDYGRGLTYCEYFNWTDDPRKQGCTYVTYDEDPSKPESHLQWVLDMIPSVIGTSYTVRLTD